MRKGWSRWMEGLSLIHILIGKQGRIAKALRTVVKAAATKENKKVVVEIVSEDEK